MAHGEVMARVDEEVALRLSRAAAGKRRRAGRR